MSDGRRVMVEWLVSDRGGRVEIIDLLIEGISMAATQREEIEAMIDKRGFEKVSFDDVAPQLTNELMMQKTEAEYVKWVDKLREQTYIERKGIYAEAGRIGLGLR